MELGVCVVRLCLHYKLEVRLGRGVSSEVILLKYGGEWWGVVGSGGEWWGVVGSGGE